MSRVYFSSARALKWKYNDSMPGRLERLLRNFDLSKYFEPQEWVAVKTHFGSEGAHRIVRPIFLRKIVEALKDTGAKPFVTDTVRIKGLDYLEVANQNGLNHLSVGAPVILADGNIISEIAVASVIHDVPAMVVCSHVKGHIQAGYAGAIKNIAMGGVSAMHRECGWKCGRGSMHTTVGEGKLVWNKDRCEICDQCQEICPLEAIKFENEVFTYNEEDCWRCGRCTSVCPSGSLSLPSDDERFMRALAESAKVVLGTFKPGKVIYINFLTEIQPECDCMPIADVPVIQDQGILISDDVVSIEQASSDMLLKAPPLPQSASEEKSIVKGEDILYRLSEKPYWIQFEESEKLGLGSRKYELIKL
jgi:uncharacterized Fe-S center protein